MDRDEVGLAAAGDAVAAAGDALVRIRLEGDLSILEISSGSASALAGSTTRGALVPTPPAILGVIRHAAGVRIRRVPAPPSRVRAALLDQNEG